MPKFVQTYHLKARPARGNHGSRDRYVNTPPPVPLDYHADGHTKVYFLMAINEGIASELLARNRRRISVRMARVASMHVTVPADGRNKCVQYR
jgi:hypothetical protein